MFVGSKNKYQSRTRQGFYIIIKSGNAGQGQIYHRQLTEMPLYYLHDIEISKGSVEKIPSLNIFVNMEIPSNIHIKQLFNNLSILADLSEISHKKSE